MQPLSIPGNTAAKYFCSLHLAFVAHPPNPQQCMLYQYLPLESYKSYHHSTTSNNTINDDNN